MGIKRNTAEIWEQSVAQLRSSLDPQIFAAWIAPLSVQELISENGDSGLKLEIVTPNRFSCDHIRRYYGTLIQSTVSGNSGNEVDITYKVTSNSVAKDGFSESSSLSPLKNTVNGIITDINTKNGLAGPVDSNGDPTGSIRKMRKSRPPTTNQKTSVAIEKDYSNLNPNYNFSNFVVGSCNQFAHAVSLQVAQNLGASYNPLFIYGGVGLGKTHLVNAIGNYARRHDKNVLIVSSEVFVNELITALRSNKMQQFKDRFRSLDLLVIDDIQFLTGKERTQEEFFHTFNELHNRRKQIVLTSDKVPQELVGLEERLRTRFSSGLSADLQVPDFETRVAILTQKADSLGLEIPGEVIRLIADKIDTNIRELEGALNRLHAVSAMKQSPIDLPLACEALKDFFVVCSKDVSIESIQEVIAKRFSVSRNDLASKRRTHNIALARQIAMYVSRQLTGASFPEIGAMFGGRDHSTVIHACKCVEEKLLADASLKHELEQIEKRIRV